MSPPRVALLRDGSVGRGEVCALSQHSTRNGETQGTVLSQSIGRPRISPEQERERFVRASFILVLTQGDDASSTDIRLCDRDVVHSSLTYTTSAPSCVLIDSHDSFYRRCSDYPVVHRSFDGVISTSIHPTFSPPSWCVFVTEGLRKEVHSEVQALCSGQWVASLA